MESRARQKPQRNGSASWLTVPGSTEMRLLSGLSPPRHSDPGYMHRSGKKDAREKEFGKC